MAGAGLRLSRCSRLELFELPPFLDGGCFWVRVSHPLVFCIMARELELKINYRRFIEPCISQLDKQIKFEYNSHKSEPTWRGFFPTDANDALCVLLLIFCCFVSPILVLFCILSPSKSQHTKPDS